MLPQYLADAAVEVMSAAAPDDKVRLTRTFAGRWDRGQFSGVGSCRPPDRPARPPWPELRPPGEMPKRRKGGAPGRLAFIHAITHIELNAIDLAWDIIARFTDEQLPAAFYNDWVGVALDEAEHFALLRRRLQALDFDYGALPAHDGLWDAAERTAHDLLARLALVPMVLEARGLDTTPRAVSDLNAAGDSETADILARIGREEVPHVAAGVRWFEYLCTRRQIPPTSTFHDLVRRHFAGTVKPPFNRQLRDAAGMDIGYYAPLAPEAATSRNDVSPQHAEG